MFIWRSKRRCCFPGIRAYINFKYTPSRKYDSIAGPLEGMSVLEAREHVISTLDSANLIHSIETKMQDVPVSERGKILLKSFCKRMVC